MNAAFLQKLGLQLEGEESTTATFDPSTSLINPVSRQLISHVVFTLIGDRLIVIDPPALVGIPPIALTRLERSAQLEERLAQSLNEVIADVQRRTSDLLKLGLTAKVDPSTLVLSALVETQPFQFTISSDKRGTMRIASATRGGQELPVPEGTTFDLSEFRERAALVSYLRSLLGEQPEAPAPAADEQLPAGTVTFGELVEAFGGQAQLPPAASVEILVELLVGGERLRFAAARVGARSFRGLLAGPKGKIWAERFELDDFPGVAPLIAELMQVPIEELQIVGAARKEPA